jgi:hypothetical protein
MGLGVPEDLTPDTSWFWFFGPENVEVVLKILDGRAINGNFWVFYAALSNVEFTISVVDRETDAVAVYHNLEGQFASVGDTGAFAPGTSGLATARGPGSDVDDATVLSTLGLVGLPIADVGPAVAERGNPDKAGPCLAGGGVLCLVDGRMQVTTSWRDFEGNQGIGTASPLAGDTTGYFWFFNQANVEVVIKILDGRVLNGRYWVFVAALSNVQFTITVQDLLEGGSVSYTNPLGTFASFADTGAL